MFYRRPDAPRLVRKPQSHPNFSNGVWIYGTWGFSLWIVWSSATEHHHSRFLRRTNNFGIRKYKVVELFSLSRAADIPGYLLRPRPRVRCNPSTILHAVEANIHGKFRVWGTIVEITTILNPELLFCSGSR